MVPKIDQFPNPMGGTPKDDPMKNVSSSDYSKVQNLLQDLKMAEAFGQANRIANIKAELVNLGYNLPPDKSQSSISVFGQGNNQLQRPEGYVVQKGDTLSKIAKQFNLNLQDLIAANPEIKNPNAIQLGQAIRLPSSKLQSAPAPEQPAPAPAPVPGKDTASEEEPPVPAAENPAPAEENAPAEKKPLTQAPPPPNMNADQQKVFDNYLKDIQQYKEADYEVKYDEKHGFTYVDMTGDGNYDKCYNKDGSIRFDLTIPMTPEEEAARRNAGREPAVWYNPFTWF